MHTTTRWLAPALALGLAAGITLSGCSSTPSSTSTTGAAGSSTTAAASSGAYGNSGATTTTTAASTSGTAGTGGSGGTTNGSAANASVALAVATTPIGKILTDANGMTLYIFKKDSATSSACNAGCDAQWPPVPAATAGTGVDADSLTTITRSDGSKQAEYYGHPLYTFKGDQAAGDLNGQGFGGQWYVIDTEGNLVTAKAP
jgi:predicted lipoprotein with Yx(FWY)xxD motif